MKYEFQLEYLNTVIILRSNQGKILNISKKVEDSFFTMNLIAKDIYYDKVTNRYWKKKSQLITIHDYELIQEEFIEVTLFLVENKKLSRELKQDPLTKIGNVAAANAKETDILLNGKSCVIVICDVNDFKTINDTFGHMVGDKALQGVAKILDKNKRSAQDCVCRIGGDEFLLFFETSQITCILEKMCTIQKEIKLLGEELGIPLSISVGLSLYLGDSDIYDAQKKELLHKKEEADQALYYVKTTAGDKNSIAYLNQDTQKFVLYNKKPAKIKVKNK